MLVTLTLCVNVCLLVIALRVLMAVLPERELKDIAGHVCAVSHTTLKNLSEVCRGNATTAVGKPLKRADDAASLCVSVQSKLLFAVCG